MVILDEPLRWGENCDVGWTGFIARKHSFIAAGISWFSRWDEISHVPVEHTFIISKQDETIEAFQNGIRAGTLSAYINDPDVAILVRQPAIWTPDIGARIVERANKHIGEDYNDALIAADALVNTFLGHWLNHVSRGAFAEHLTKLADSDKRWICSKLVAYANSIQELEALGGVLANPAAEAKPIDLFEDLFIYGPGAFELLPTGPA